MIDAVVFDLDGVLLDSEQRWNEAKEALVRETGGTWRDEAEGRGDMPYPPDYPKMPGEPKRVQPSRDRDRPRG